MSRVLLLVGHGASSGAEASAPVYAHAERIRTRHMFAAVRVAFWKEAPFVHHALDDIAADDVRVVPMFLADGYFVRDVLPQALRITEAQRALPARIIHYCRPLALHPLLPSLVLRRARECAPLSLERRRSATLVVIGHGTERNRHSGAVVRRIAAELNGLGRYREVTCGFLDEAPRVADVVAGIDSADVLLVPFLMAEGGHTRVTIPEAIGLTGVETRRATQTLWYSAAVGTRPEVADIVVELALETSHDISKVVPASVPGSVLPDQHAAAVEQRLLQL